jgi:hypothetical protein
VVNTIDLNLIAQDEIFRKNGMVHGDRADILARGRSGGRKK